MKVLVDITRRFNIISHGPGPTTAICLSIYIKSMWGKVLIKKRDGKWDARTAEESFKKYVFKSEMELANELADVLRCKIKIKGLKP